MPKICYRPKRFETVREAVVEMADEIITAYMAQGYGSPTLRQIYYQFVARDAFPDDRRWHWTGAKWVRDPNGTKNAEPNYNWLGEIINEARLAGRIDWRGISDRTRHLVQPPAWDNPSDIISACASSYKIDKWANQEWRPEVWIEKDALVGVIEAVCERLNIPYLSCRGYTSQSEMWGSAMRFKQIIRNGQAPVIIHLGDHDPSGIDMTGDIERRLAMFLGVGEWPINRVALNMNQIEEINPPPSPAKITDSRAVKYIEIYGDDSWELDALEPGVITELIESKVLEYRDEDLWAEKVEEEQRGLDRLQELAAKEAKRRK